MNFICRGTKVPSIRRFSHIAVAKNCRRLFFKFPTPFDAFNESIQEYQVKKTVNVPPAKMFEIVSDVSKYKEFVPFVEKSYITKHDDEGMPSIAGLRVGWNQFDEQFECTLRCQKDRLVIAESANILIFDTLYTKWNFREVQNAGSSPSCEVTLELKYHFKNPLYNTVSSLFSDQVSKIMIEAFEKRAMKSKIKDKLHT